MKEKFDVAVIGAGPGGYVAAIRCAQLGLKTVCIDKRKELGGTCLNVGCIPSKALLQSSEHFARAKLDFKKHGIETSELRCNFPVMMERKQEILSSFQMGISALFKKNKVEHLQGTASFVDPHTIKVDQKEIEAKFFIIATGSEPIPLPFLPFDEKSVLSSTGALALEEIPKTLLIIGAGVIGVELGSVYSRLGTKVTFVEFADRVCSTFDRAISKELLGCLEKQGMEFLLSTKVTHATKEGAGVVCKLDPEKTLLAEKLLVAIGRRAVTRELDLEKIGLSLSEKGQVPIDRSFRTKIPHIFAIGDVVEGAMLAHKASEEGIAVAEIIAGKSPVIEYIAIPNVIYTHPEVGSVGMTEEDCKKSGIESQSASFPFRANSRAKCMGDDHGFVKIVIEKKSERILGMHIVGPSASEMIAIGAILLTKRMALGELLHTPFAHPTLSEAIKEAAMAIQGRAIHK